jgi:hypothetical protein
MQAALAASLEALWPPKHSRCRPLARRVQQDLWTTYIRDVRRATPRRVPQVLLHSKSKASRSQRTAYVAPEVGRGMNVEGDHEVEEKSTRQEAQGAA